QNWTQGALENTNRATDLALNGDGFFLAKSDLGTLLTRAGNFSFNRDGQFVTANGLSVQGWGFDADGNVVTGVLKDVQIDPAMTTPPKRTASFTLGSNLSSADETGSTQTISHKAYDNGGGAHTLLINFEKMTTIGEEYDVVTGLPLPGSGADSPVHYWQAVVQDEDGNDLLDNGGAQQVYNVYFNADGELSDAAGTPIVADQVETFEWDMQGVGFEDFDLDFGGVGRTGVTGYSGSTTVSITEQDGYTAGVVTSFSVNQEGILELNFSNDQQEKMFQLGIGQVTNPSGLEQIGENFYALTTASGELQVRQAGRESRAVVVAGTLEMSNVDLASEFTDMIVAQRGFQASARIITSSDELLQETVQLKR
ncbi:MAG: flagellar hook-basal body complex protein, partial [Rhodothermales bacterium]